MERALDQAMNTDTFPKAPLSTPCAMIGTGAVFKLDGLEFVIVAKTSAQLDMVLDGLGIVCDHSASRRIGIAPAE